MAVWRVILCGLVVGSCGGLTNGTVDQPGSKPIPDQPGSEPTRDQPGPEPTSNLPGPEPTPDAAEPALLPDGSNPVSFYCMQWVWDVKGPADILCESRLKECQVQLTVERQLYPKTGHFSECFARKAAECARMMSRDGVEREVCGGDEGDCLIRMEFRKKEGYRTVRFCRRISGLELPAMREAEQIP